MNQDNINEDHLNSPDDDEEYKPEPSRNVRLVKHIFEPSNDALLGVSIVSKSMPLRLATNMAVREVFNKDRHEWLILPNGRRVLKRYIPIDEIAELYYLKLTRAVDGKLLEYGALLAESQELEDMEGDQVDIFRNT